MHCMSCGSENLGKFIGELAIHFSGLTNLDEPHVYVSPLLVVCLDCGVGQFAVPEAELRLLQRGSPNRTTIPDSRASGPPTITSD